jgi:hypothetical protein
MHGEDKYVAIRGRIHKVAPVAMRRLWTYALATYVLKIAITRVQFKGLFYEL